MIYKAKMPSEATNLEKLGLFAARLVFRIFRVYFEIIEDIARFILPDYRRPRAIQQIIEADSNIAIDDRIKKIDSARENLQEAISAIDELRSQADLNRKELEEALGRIAQAERQKEEISVQLTTLKQVAEVDTEAFRKVVGLPTKGDLWGERIIGFVSGIIASIIASIIFLLAQHFLLNK